MPTNSPLAYGTEWDTSIGERAISYLLYKNAGAPSNGVTLANVAPVGCLLVDTTVTGSTTGFYQNTGTTASPTWTALTTATGAGTYTGNFDGIIGANTPAAATVTTLATSGIVTMGSVAAAVSAAGTTRTNATALTKQFNNVATVAASTAGVILPASAVGVPIFVWNSGANNMNLYAAGSDTIDGTAGVTGVTLTKQKGGMFMCIATNTYVSFAAVNSA